MVGGAVDGLREGALEALRAERGGDELADDAGGRKASPARPRPEFAEDSFALGRSRGRLDGPTAAGRSRWCRRRSSPMRISSSLVSVTRRRRRGYGLHLEGDGLEACVQEAERRRSVAKSSSSGVSALTKRTGRPTVRCGSAGRGAARRAGRRSVRIRGDEVFDGGSGDRKPRSQ